MPDLSSLRLVKVPSTAPPYDCQVHGARCPAGADVVPGRAGFAGCADFAGWRLRRSRRRRRFRGCPRGLRPRRIRWPRGRVSWPW